MKEQDKYYTWELSFGAASLRFEEDMLPWLPARLMWRVVFGAKFRRLRKPIKIMQIRQDF